jgi:hypothetical protein
VKCTLFVLLFIYFWKIIKILEIGLCEGGLHHATATLKMINLCTGDTNKQHASIHSVLVVNSVLKYSVLKYCILRYIVSIWKYLSLKYYVMFTVHFNFLLFLHGVLEDDRKASPAAC